MNDFVVLSGRSYGVVTMLTNEFKNVTVPYAFSIVRNREQWEPIMIKSNNSQLLDYWRVLLNRHYNEYRLCYSLAQALGEEED